MKNIFTYSAAAVLGLGLLAAPKADAQQFSKRKKYNSVGFSLNAMNYFGDLVPQTDFTSFRFNSTRINAGVSLSRRFYPRITGRLGLSVGQISGDDALAASQTDPDAKFRNNRNMNFRNTIVEMSGVVIFDLIENRNTYLKRPDFVPYVFGGVAGFYHSPQGGRRDANGNIGSYVSLSDLATEGVKYSQLGFALPFGGGVRYRINRNFDASLEIGWRKTFTDYLDDVSGVYTDLSKASPDAQYFGGYTGGGAPSITRSTTGEFAGFNSVGTARRGKDGNDWYIVTGLALNYILTPKIKNPKFR
jgi:Domain of unknown function (DUF6089)